VSGFRLTPQAGRDLDEIVAYLAQDSPAAADRVIVRLLDACRAISQSPGIGHLRPDLTDRPVRFFTVRRRHTIVYREGPDGIDVLRIFSARRDVANLLLR